MKYLMRVNIHFGYLHVRKSPSITSPIIGKINKRQTVIATEQKNGWYKHDHGGWSYGRYLILEKNLGSSSSVGKKVTSTKPKKTTKKEEQMTEYEIQILKSINARVEDTENIDDMKYVYGAPFQFNEIADPTPSPKCKLGRNFMSRMLSDMSLLIITPGKADFMKGFGRKASNAAIRNILNESDSNSNSLRDMLEGKQMGRYYEFSSCYTEYMKYVNNMCRVAAIYLGIGDERLYPGSKKFKDFDWDIGNFNGSSSLFSFLTQERSVAFYMDASNSSFSDGMSNSSDQSMLAGLMNQGNDAAKEIRFLTGKSYSDKGMLEANTNNLTAAVEKIVDGISHKLPGKIGQRIGDYSVTLVNGGNIIFPEIPKDSSYNRSMSIVTKLISPYGDKRSIYRYILVPLFHWIALAYPRQLGANGYLHPFLIRAFCKGFFNCSMGMIDSISITKADDSTWSVDGLPTEVTVSISIKDLYGNLTIPKAGDMSTFYNTEFLDMLATWCGVNINKPEISRKMNLIVPFLKNTITDAIPNMTESTVENIRRTISNFLR